MKLIIPFVLLLNLLHLQAANADESTWQAPFVGSNPTVLYYPDTNAVYWRYGWTRKPGDQQGLVITGQMPDVRYFSYNVYDDNTKDTVGSLTDFQIQPDKDASNPFKNGKAVAGETYTLYVLPEGSNSTAKNVLYFPDHITNVSTFLRHYVSTGNINGNVPLPKIALFDAKTNKISPAAASNDVPKLSKTEFKKYVVPMLKKMMAEFKADPAATLEQIHIKKSADTLDIKQLVATEVVAKTFSYYKKGEIAESYNFVASGTYPNKDNHYLSMPAIREAGEVLIYKFKSPPVVTGPQDYPNAPVRYFSLSQGDAATFTHGDSVIDQHMKQNADGFVYFIIGDDSPELRAKADALGANFMPWLAGNKIFLIYRHMLPRDDFNNATNKVAVFDRNKPLASQAGSLYIGDYAPRGIMVKAQTLISAQAMPRF